MKCYHCDFYEWYIEKGLDWCHATDSELSISIIEEDRPCPAMERAYEYLVCDDTEN